MGFENAEIRPGQPGLVIGKEIIGRSFRGVLNYVSDAKNNFKKTGGERPFFTNMLGKTPRELASEFGWMRATKTGVERAVSHYIISPGNGLSDDQLREVIRTGLREMGYEECQFAAYIHRGKDRGGDDEHEHIHIIVNRIYIDSETCMPAVVSDSKNYERVHKASRAIESALGREVQVQKEKTKNGPAKDQAAFNAHHRGQRLNNQSEAKGKPMSDNVRPIRPIITTAKRREKLAQLAEQAADDAANAEAWKNNLERLIREQLEEELDIVFSHRRRDDPSSEIIGYSFYSPADGGFIKASNISREISWTHIQRALAVNLDERRRRSNRINSAAAAAAEIEASRDLARDAQRTPGLALGALAPQFSRLQARPDAPAQVQAAPGVQLDGFQAELHADGMTAWHYMPAGAPDAPASLIDLPDAGAILLTQAGLEAGPRAAIRAWLQLAAARHGKLLDVQGQVLDDPALRQIVLEEAAAIDGLSLHPLGAAIAEARRAMAAAPAVAEVSAPAGADALDLLTAPAARAAPAAGSPSASSDALPAASVGPAAELARSMRRAREIAELDTDKRRPALPGANASAADVRAALAGFEALRDELEAFIALTRERHAVENRASVQDGSAAGRTAAERVLLAALSAARSAGEQHAVELARDRVRAAQDAVAVARYERDQQGPVAVLAEKIGGKKAAEIAALEETEHRERAELARQKAAFLQQPDVQEKVGALQQQMHVQDHERNAMHVASSLLRLLSILIEKIAAMAGILERKERQEREREAEREAYKERARGLAQGLPDVLAQQQREDDERERQRGTLRQGQR